MDDAELEAAFRAAADGGPEARFGHADVVRASDRITARRRSQVRGAVAALVVVAGLGGVGGAVALTRASAGNATSTAAAPDADTRREAVPGGAGASSGDGTLPSGGVAQGGAGPLVAPPAPASGRPLGPGTGPCANRQDPALRALLNAAQPGAAGAPGAATSDICLPGAQRYVSIEFGGDVLTVAYLPPGTDVSLAPGSISARTASGGTVIVPQAYPQLLDRLASQL
jgi:hypothetical protein